MKTPVILILTLASSFFALADLSAQAGGRQLAYKLKPGEQFFIQYVDEQSIETQRNGAPYGAVQSQTMVYRCRVEQAGTAGNMLLNFQLDSTEMIQKLADYESVYRSWEKDNTSINPYINQTFAVFDKLIGSSFSVEFDRFGKPTGHTDFSDMDKQLIAAFGLDASSLEVKAMLEELGNAQLEIVQSCVMSFPEKAIKSGDFWVATESGNDIVNTFESTWTVSDMNNKTTELTLTTKIPKEGKEVEMEMIGIFATYNVKGNKKGKALIDTRSGMTQLITLDYDLTADGTYYHEQYAPDGEPIPMRIKGKSRLRFFK